MTQPRTRAEFAVADMAPADIPRLTKTLLIPRPIAWVGTRSADGVDNLAPHSFFTMVSNVPPILVFASTGRKDTLANIEVKKAASIAKVYTTEAAVTSTRIATQIFGGNGFMEEYPVARFYRDSKILEIGEGTSEVQRMLIARSYGL